MSDFDKKPLDYQGHSEFVLGRLDMLNRIRELQPTIKKIVMEGIESPEEEQVARGVCSFILSELEYEDSNESVMARNASNN